MKYNGTKSRSGCGTEPVLPVIEQGSVEAYNKSVMAINEWQQKVNNYNTSLINEADTDNALVANTANGEQSRLRVAIEKIKTDTDAAKAKSDSK